MSKRRSLRISHATRWIRTVGITTFSLLISLAVGIGAPAQAQAFNAYKEGKNLLTAVYNTSPKELGKYIRKNPKKITEMLKTVVNNYRLYYQCSNKVDGWQEWYDKQKKIFEELKP